MHANSRNHLFCGDVYCLFIEWRYRYWKLVSEDMFLLTKWIRTFLWHIVLWKVIKSEYGLHKNSMLPLELFFVRWLRLGMGWIGVADSVASTLTHRRPGNPFHSFMRPSLLPVQKHFLAKPLDCHLMLANFFTAFTTFFQVMAWVWIVAYFYGQHVLKAHFG